MRMTLKKQIISVLLVFFLIFQISPVYASEPNDTNEALYGTWVGTYMGYTGDTPVERTIDMVIDYSASGTVEGTITVDGGDNGVYLFDGSVDYETNEISFQGTEWIDNPGDMAFSEFYGTVDVKQGTITGCLDNVDDRIFFIEKISSDYTSRRIDLDNIPREWEGEYDGSNGYSPVRRDYEIHIKRIDDDGYIEGVAIISPSLKAAMEDGANGSYYFSGKINARSGKIDLQGYEWIEYPVSHSNFEFVELYGFIDVKTGTISGYSENGTWEMEEIKYGNIKTESGFELEKDNNYFVHTDIESWDGAGFVRVKNYKMDDEYFEKLTRYSSKGEKNEIKKDMRNSDWLHWFGKWDGSCYGIAMTMGLLFEGHIDISDLTDYDRDTYYSLKYPYKDPKFLNVLHYYQLSQNLKIGGKRDAAQSYVLNSDLFDEDVYMSGGYDSLPVFLKKVVKYCSSEHVELLGYSTRDSGHAILITGCEYDENEEKYIVKLYDENSVDSSDDIGAFSKMKINKDFSGFALYDEYGNEEATDETFVAMYFLDWERLQPLLHTQRSMQYDYDTRINFPINSEFEITNEYGEKLSYRNGKFSGDMEIKEVNTIDYDDEVRIALSVESTDVISVSDISENIDINVTNQDDFASLSASEIAEAIIQPGDSIHITGADYTFESFISTDEISEDENGLTSVSGEADSEIDIIATGSNVTVESETVIENVKTGVYEGTNVTERDCEVSDEHFNIDENGQIDVVQENLDDAVVELSQNKFVYNGTRKKPAVTVTLGNDVLEKDVDYSVTYENNKYVGTASVTVKGINDYVGEVYKNFNIVPKGTYITKLKGKKKSLTVKWKTQKKSTTGYQIQYSTNKNFKTYKNKLVKGNKKYTSKISKLKAKKKYYVRIRTYKVVKGTKYYSSWSKVKTIKTK